MSGGGGGGETTTTKVMRSMMKHSQTVLGQRVPANWRRFKSPDKIHTKEF